MTKDTRGELVRIDSSGVAHPIGAVASQRLRARAGAFRLLPSPPHIVFMRFTGEDGRRDAEDGAVVRLAGEITQPGAMCDVVALLTQTGWRGELAVLDGDAVRSIFFEQGNVVGVTTTVEEERFGMVLFRFGAITKEQYEVLMEKIRGGARSGQAAVDLGFVPMDRVFKHLGMQIEEVVYAVLTVGDGTFFFLDGFDESRLVSRHSLSASSLLMDAVTRMDEMRYFQQKIPSSAYVPHRLPAAGAPAEEYRATLDAVNGELSIEEIGRITGRGEFATTKDVYALMQSKHLGVQPPRPSGGLAALVATANEALRFVHEEAERAGRGEELRDSLQSFAVGAGVYDILFRGAGPDARGLLDADRVTVNAALVAHGEDPESILRQMLHDYAGFALFSSGGWLGADQEAALSRKVGPLLAGLQQKG